MNFCCPLTAKLLGFKLGDFTNGLNASKNNQIDGLYCKCAIRPEPPNSYRLMGICILSSCTPQQDYQTYVSRKAQKRQSLIVSLSDDNQQQLRELQRQREELTRDYEEKRAGQTNATRPVIVSCGAPHVPGSSWMLHV